MLNADSIPRDSRLLKNSHLAVAFLIAVAPLIGAQEITLSVSSQEWEQWPVQGIDPNAESFVVEALIDPVIAKGGDLQVVSGIVFGLQDDSIPVSKPLVSLRLHLREGAQRASFDLWNRGIPLSKQIPHPRPTGWTNPSDEYQNPAALPFREGIGHRIKIVVWPSGDGSRIRLFVDFDDRPTEDHIVDERIRAGVVKLFTTRGGQDSNVSRTSRLTLLRAESIDASDADSLPSSSDSVLAALDLSHPKMQPVARAMRQDNRKLAKKLLLEHMRTRQKPVGPSLKEAEATAYHPDWQVIADEVLANRYGTIGYFSQFASEWTDTTGQTHSWVLQQKPLRVNWPRCNGHLNRHFHWVSLARAWKANPNPEYARRFSAEVLDWVSREPFFWDRCPTVGGVNLMDGTMFRWGYMNTSNIGRRLELTWWPAYEVFRKSPDFDDDAHLAMLLGMLRQARLIMNPSSFAAHDDGGAHTTMALLQTALLLPEFAESAEWKATALRRWDQMLKAQFHPDGTHVSLSTGYSWASIASLENYLRLMKRFGDTPAKKYLDILERAFEHPMLLSTPSQTQIDLNDGGWSMVDDHFRRAVEWFPHRQDFRWMATRGAEGTSPNDKSLYFPNAGQYFMRTGWGPEEKYLFFGAGPWGASHGKFDALNIYAQFGGHLLIRNAGRGSYSGVGNTVHAGRSLSFNTLSPDWAQENSIPQWKQDMHRGFGPPKRRWISNERFDFGEGAYEYGWYRVDEHIQGKWLRQVAFVKGDVPKKDGYFVVVDTVEPADSKVRTWRHPWQLGLNSPNISIRKADKSVTAISDHVAMQILPVDTSGDIHLSVISEQEKPELLGWRIYDKIAKPWPVPTYRWQSDSTFSRAWIIQLQQNQEHWPIESISEVECPEPGELNFTVNHRGGRTDRIERRFPVAGKVDFKITCRDPNSTVVAELRVDEGSNSVARPK